MREERRVTRLFLHTDPYRTGHGWKFNLPAEKSGSKIGVIIFLRSVSDRVLRVRK